MTDNDCHCHENLRCNAHIYKFLHKVDLLPFAIVDAIVYEPNRKPKWYFTHKHGPIKRKHSYNVTPENILASFSASAYAVHSRATAFSHPPCDIIATFTHSSCSSLRPDQPPVLYLTQVHTSLILEHLHSPSNMLTGILQPFINPKDERNTVYRLDYTHPLCNDISVRRTVPRVNIGAPSSAEYIDEMDKHVDLVARQNMNELCSRTLTCEERAIVFDTPNRQLIVPTTAQIRNSTPINKYSHSTRSPVLTASLHIQPTPQLKNVLQNATVQLVSALNQQILRTFLNNDRASRLKKAEDISECRHRSVMKRNISVFDSDSIASIQCYFKVDWTGRLRFWYARNLRVFRLDTAEEKWRTACSECGHTSTYVSCDNVDRSPNHYAKALTESLSLIVPKTAPVMDMLRKSLSLHNSFETGILPIPDFTRTMSLSVAKNPNSRAVTPEVTDKKEKVFKPKSRNYKQDKYLPIPSNRSLSTALPSVVSTSSSLYVPTNDVPHREVQRPEWGQYKSNLDVFEKSLSVALQ